MPLYTYRREDGTTFEIRQSFADSALTQDPDTGQKVSRVVHNAGVIFKGSGFYKNDHKDSAKSGKSGAAKEAKDGGDSSASASEPAAKSADTAKSEPAAPAASSTPAPSTAG